MEWALRCIHSFIHSFLQKKEWIRHSNMLFQESPSRNPTTKILHSHSRKLVANKNNSASADAERMGAFSRLSSVCVGVAASLVMSSMESLACDDLVCELRDVSNCAKSSSSSSSSRLMALRDVDSAIDMKSMVSDWLFGMAGCFIEVDCW